MHGRLFYCIALMVLWINSASAWGRDGHKMVDKIALHYMNRATIDSLQKYIGSNIEEAGCWMDEIKSDPAYDYLKPLHYINIEKGERYHPQRNGNIISELDTVINQLKHRSNYSKDQIAVDIKILMHLLGDITQPLHVGYGKDRGGNTVQLCFLEEYSNLHRVWDSDIIRYKKITADSCLRLSNHMTAHEIARIGNSNPIKWMNQSRSKLHRLYRIHYNDIDKKYINSNTKIVEEQILYGGIRLSHLLNELFASNQSAKKP